MLPDQKALIDRRNFEKEPTAEQLQFGALKHAHSCLRAKDFAKKQQRQLPDLG